LAAKGKQARNARAGVGQDFESQQAVVEKTGGETLKIANLMSHGNLSERILVDFTKGRLQRRMYLLVKCIRLARSPIFVRHAQPSSAA
jgi:hypothetical protein